jgi:hypothetical protein
MTQIDDTVKKLFGHDQWTDKQKDHTTIDFIKKAIKEAPNSYMLNHDRTSQDIIKDFLFEHTDIAKELKKIMEKVNDSPEEKNT